MAIEIVDLPMKNGDVRSFFVCLPEGKHMELSEVMGVPLVLIHF